jgi:hypothetical protein
VLSISKPTDGLVVACVRYEVKAPESFHCDDLAASDGIDGSVKCILMGGNDPAVDAPKLQMWPADWAGVRLGVETAVRGVIVLAPTGFTHREPSHRGVWPVVGKRPDDREPGTAIGTIREGIEVAAVGRVKNLAKTVGTGGDIREDESRALTGAVARTNLELLEADQGKEGVFKAVDRGSGWPLTLDAEQKLPQSIRRPFDFQKHPLG